MTERESNGSSVLPILIALAIVLVVLIGLGISWLVRGDSMSDDLRVARAAVGQNDALQRDSYPDFRRYTCPAEQGNEAEVLARQEQSKSARGARFVDDVADVVITGDRATATVTYHFERTADNKIKVPMNFVRADGDWTVCSPGPA